MRTTAARQSTQPPACADCARFSADVSALAYIVSEFQRLGHYADAAQNAAALTVAARSFEEHVGTAHALARSAA